MPDTTAREVLKAWKAWDDACDTVASKKARAGALSIEKQAAAFEVAAGNHAAALGLRTTQLRDLLTAWRRAGYARADALLAVELVVAALGTR